MKRRQVLQSLAATGLLAATGCTTPRIVSARDQGEKRLRPPALQAGDEVALVCPAGPITESRLERAVQNLGDLGFVPRPATHVLAQRGFNAGTVEQRLENLHWAFAEPSVKAVWAVRGGYGATQLLPYLDFELIRCNPKLLIGYSDITALLNPIYQRTGLVGLHGPVGSSTFTELATDSFKATAIQGKAPYTAKRLDYGKSLVAGTAEGVLAGGNLTLLAAMCGTPFEVDLTDKILFLEDIGETPYRIDRMLVQLHQSSNLKRAAGIALGDFVDCEAKPDDNSLSLEQTLRDQLGDLGIPVYWGLPFGHGNYNVTLPIGISARLDAGSGTLTILEPAVRT